MTCSFCGQTNETEPQVENEALRVYNEYLKVRCANQDELIAELQQKVHSMTTTPKSIDDATTREWSLASSLSYAKKDNSALRELCEDYRGKIRSLVRG